MSSSEDGIANINAPIDAFYKVLLDHGTPTQDIKILQETTESDLSRFLQNEAANQPGLNLVESVLPVQKVFQVTYTTGKSCFNLEESSLQQLYGILRAVLRHGFNKYKDLRTTTRLLEELGRSSRWILGESSVLQEIWKCCSLVSQETIRFCIIYVSEGPVACLNSLSPTISRIHNAQTAYIIGHGQTLLTTRMKYQTEKLLDTYRDDKIYKWLKPPDPSSNFQVAIDLHQDGTGEWLVCSDQFLRWKITENSILWLHGKPGCGKTVLSSTAIEEIQYCCETASNRSVAYFFFSFTDSEKQKPQNMLRSVIAQLLRQRDTVHNAATNMYSAHLNGERQPSKDGLMHLLRQLVDSFGETYLVLDALDECTEREMLLELIDEFHSWNLKALHVMVTSRKEVDIEDGLEHLLEKDNKINAQSDIVDRDIRRYVRSKVQYDNRFKKWRKYPTVQQEIEDTLANKADGMFRWAACQLDVLAKCLNLPTLRLEMGRLPKTLDETYARILQNIPDVHQVFAVKLLNWLLGAKRPPTLHEMVEVFAIETDSELKFDPDRRFPEPRDVLLICPGMIDSVQTISSNTGEHVEELQLAHFSVQEYLISDRVSKEIKIYHIQIISVDVTIFRDCLHYIWSISNNEDVSSNSFKAFPLLRYALLYLIEHAKALGPVEKKDIALILELFRSKVTFSSFVKQYNKEQGNNWTLRLAEGTTLLYYLSDRGVHEVVKELLAAGADVNAQGGEYGNALQAASFGGHEEIVKQLLAAGADVNAQGGYFGNALQAASFGGHEEILKQLLAAGADVNAQGGWYSNALQAASEGGHEEIMKQLLAAGADVNVQGGEYSNALQAASEGGHEEIVKQLLAAGADVNAQGGDYSNALRAASERGHEEIVKRLLAAGADVNAQGGWYGNALQAASFGGHEEIVKQLLAAGADVNAQGGYFGNALQAASFGGREEIVKQLLAAGADVNAQGGKYGNALQAASKGGHEEIVKQLLAAGADVNAQGGYYSNALQAASFGGHEEIVKQLLAAGADVNAQGGDYGNALQAASERRHEEIVKQLLAAGADVNAQGGWYGNALRSASKGGHEEIVKQLLAAGADVNAQGGYFSNALQAASFGGHEEIVKQLLAAGADVNTQCEGEYGNALQAASKGGHEEIVKRLLAAGADVNAQGGWYSNALQAASEGGHEEIVKRLLAAGADVNAQGRWYGNALQAASKGGHEEIVKQLLAAGADVNTQGEWEYSNALNAASEGGHEESVKQLLAAGADVNAQGGYYGNALHAASKGGHEEIIKQLLAAGADVNAQGGEYDNALQAASFGGHEEIVKQLLVAGADVNTQCEWEYSNALQAASKGGHEEIVKQLLAAGADVNAQGRYYGNALQAALCQRHEEIGEYYGNALQAASKGGHEEIVKQLLAAGADVNAQGGKYGNALQAASAYGYEEIEKELLAAGADVNAQGGYYSNALQAASFRGHEEIVKQLLAAGADVDA
ncbi:hypothetical protein BP6252_11942 [Coleophoma cylindrospora]|uniref:Nephrocystin 3-like N-terminal domain-containing protein n=1 Tax=Coleophoma cylindrospora TaxID=1849047 RepID=A0A3D8QFF5_9HELO|nr:hypothetical protein BP6252_11942 [Coleophoma cylindrospora]